MLAEHSVRLKSSGFGDCITIRKHACRKKKIVYTVQSKEEGQCKEACDKVRGATPSPRRLRNLQL